MTGNRYNKVMTDNSVTKSIPISTTAETAAEYLRLSLARLGQLNLPITPVNYALIYFYMAGEDVELNARLDELFEDMDQWSEEEANELFSRYVCQCDGAKDKAMEQELLGMVAQILGMVIDLSGRAALSSDSLETHLGKLAGSSDPGDVLQAASDIIAETRGFVEDTRQFESSLRESTQEIKHLKDELDNARKQATVDSLTNLHNRRGFDRALNRAIESVKAGEKTFCLVILDIDHFKTVNDSHGHLVGDKVLKGISRQLFRQMRGNDFLSRYGGEEFAILLLDTPITSAFTVAENIRKSIGNLRLKHTKTGVQIGKVTISIGVACFRVEESGEDVIQRCDKALYRAKSLGRDRTVLAD